MKKTESVLHYMKLHANTLPPVTPSPHTIGILLETILKNNNLSFMEKHFLTNTLTPVAPSPHTIRILLETILRKNNLSFMDRHFPQLTGTTIGTKAAPPYDNLFMGRHKEATQEAFIWAISFWERFIDDLFLIFLGTTEQLQSMKNFMNNLHPKIKFLNTLPQRYLS